MLNISALMEHISRHLHTIVRHYSPDGKLLEQICKRTDVPTVSETFDNIWTDSPYMTKDLEQILITPGPSDRPKVSANHNFVAYMTITLSDRSTFLSGPVRLTNEEGYLFTIPACNYETTWLDSLYSCDLIEFVTETLLLYNLFSKETLTPIEVAAFNTISQIDFHRVQKKCNEIIFNNRENATFHNPYSQEVREFSAIRNGDIEKLKKSIAEDYQGTVGTLAKNHLRSFQNIAIVLITLASRAAMEGGVLPELAYSLSDSYIQKIEEMHIPEAAVQLARQAEFYYAELVHEVKTSEKKQQVDVRINQCKEYIFSHLHGKLSTSDIAVALHITPNYLSNLFKQEEGMTITKYIQREKIKLVQNLLIYSDYSYSTIAAYLGFSSQSHLGKVFKQITGMTMHQYREHYGKTTNYI